jgi:hypothetical protein
MSHSKKMFQDKVNDCNNEQLDTHTATSTDSTLLLVIGSALDKLITDQKDLYPAEMAGLISSLYELNQRTNSKLHSA